MPTVDILIPNHNSGPVLDLCVESIRARTHGQEYRIVVHDESDFPHDREYLARAEERGWLKYVRGTTRANFEQDRMRWASSAHPAPYWHGCAINVLLHGHCRADYAMVIDADVYIISDEWLGYMLGLMDDGVIVAAHEWQSTKRARGIYVPGWWRPHFLMLNMRAYHDGMHVDWRGGTASVAEEPYRTVFARLSPESRPGFDGGTAIFDPGSSLWMKMATDNPRGYRGVPLPEGAEQTLYRHFKQKSLRNLGLTEWGEVAKELARLRAAA